MKRSKSKKPVVLDLFAGAGGLSAGFAAAGFEIGGAVEKTRIFSKTHEYNFPGSKSISADITELPPKEYEKTTGLKPGMVDIIIGGPPCQSFSTIGTPKINSLKGKGGLTDPRNYLFQPYLDYVKHYKPRMFVMENVPALQTKYGGLLFNHLLEEINEFGYEPHITVLNAAEYGVPQLRRRLFVVGVQPGVHFSFPQKTHYLKADTVQASLYDILGEGLKPATLVYDALIDLPKVYDGCREDELPYKRNTELTEYQKAIRNSHPTVRNNICRISNDRAKKVFAHMKQGDKYMDLPKEVRSILPFREDIFHDRLKRLDLSKPSWTVLAHIGMDGYMYIHPVEDRTLSVREAARLQSFHDSFIFVGNMREQYVQVGNAVPPLLAKAIADTAIRAF